SPSRQELRRSSHSAPARHRQVASYALPSVTGYLPSQDLTDDDRPDTAAAMVAEVYGWAGLIAGSDTPTNVIPDPGAIKIGMNVAPFVVHARRNRLVTARLW